LLKEQCRFDNATALHEIWNFAEANGGMNSFNHHMFGSVAEYFFSRLLGFRTENLIEIPSMSGRFLDFASGCRKDNCVSWKVEDGKMIVSLELGHRTIVKLPNGQMRHFDSGKFSLQVDVAIQTEYAESKIQNRFRLYAKTHLE
jgi:hypothetical protein